MEFIDMERCFYPENQQSSIIKTRKILDKLRKNREPFFARIITDDKNIYSLFNVIECRHNNKYIVEVKKDFEHQIQKLNGYNVNFIKIEDVLEPVSSFYNNATFSKQQIIIELFECSSKDIMLTLYHRVYKQLEYLFGAHHVKPYYDNYYTGAKQLSYNKIILNVKKINDLLKIGSINGISHIKPK